MSAYRTPSPHMVRLHTLLAPTLLALTAAVTPVAGQDTAAGFTLAGTPYQITGDLGGFSLTVDQISLEPGLDIVTLHLTHPTPKAPPPFSLTWSIPSLDVQGHWSTRSYFGKSLNADWYPSRVTSMLARDAPVITLFGRDDGNRLTFAVSEGLHTVRLFSGVREENGTIHNTIGFFSEKHRALTDYRVDVRIDRRAVPYHQALGDVAAWWAGYPGYAPASVPEDALLPAYSTWYSYHQNVSADALLGEIAIASRLGFTSIIVDDGWQTLDSNRGYAFTGDWEPLRLPAMKDFVDAVHHRGMKLLLWYAVPLVGEKSKIHHEFEGKYLRYWDGQGAYELDPRYPEVRAHIIDTYRTAIREWGVDGFKFDFLGRFVANAETVLEAGDGRDIASVNDATDRLMTDIMTEVRAIKPDVMIEFRQPYIGPLMRKYGNMFRAGDSPNAATANRVRTVDLRLLSGNTAVHSDMVMWHPDESVDVAALQLWNVLFAVPQVSVRLAEIPEAHLDMIRFYTDYWLRNRTVLLAGAFKARQPLLNYPLVEARTAAKRIVAVYGDVIVPVSGAPVDQLDIINATGADRVVLIVEQDWGDFGYTTFDSRGNQTPGALVHLDEGVHAFSVPRSGLIAFERNPAGSRNGP
ncbi:MAG: alpha-galactosidase [Gemmatimonadales bacterium]|nr:alpha-galactosidase [Gemmatimonadales bacterium]